MKYKNFIIKKYKAIEKAVIGVSNNLIPIIGINESGKTTILQAILSFDKNKDRYNKGEHLQYKNKYELNAEDDFSVSAEILIENNEDLEFISEKLNITVADELYKTLNNFYKEKKSIILTRIFPKKEYEVGNEELKEYRNQKLLAKALYERLPFILYFDDFSDRVPGSVEFTLNDETEKAFQPGNTDWHSILEEVFKRATSGEHSLSSFIKMDNPDDQDGLMSDIEDILNKEVIEDWKKLKKYGGQFAEEPEALELRLKHKFSDKDKKIIFKFQVKDRTNKSGRFFDIPERSKGFQWFFNFIMKLKFNPKYKEDQAGAIYLLDEPGSYLHTSAQQELLKKLKDISLTNTILYCTHSQYLLDPEIINIKRIKIAKKDLGVIEIVPFESAGITKNEGALTPLYEALHIRSGAFNKEINYPVITEGITDFYLFNLIKKHKKDFFDKKVVFLPGTGADHLAGLISQAIAFSKNYLVLLDSDTKGLDAYERYEKQFGKRESDKFFNYRLPEERQGVVLEDHLSEGDKENLKKLTGVEDLKIALSIIYYEEKKQKEFISSLTETTIKNLKIIQGKVNAIVVARQE